ncbi:MAG TPA: hypothetical protein VEL74_02360 [Thermoanaerobaculia bacterium]|nr:hypothetical protein [Thermoanaerobaculia bacterium]
MNPVSQMHVAVIQYFSGEKRESVLFIAAGVLAIIASVVLLWKGSPLRGMAYPLIAIALIQLVVGWTVFARTDGQTRSLHTHLQGDPGGYAAAELARMDKVQRSFQIYKVIEIVLMAAGVAGLFLLRDRQTLYAVSRGLALQAGLMLAFDLAAERRADIYVNAIRTLGRALEENR